MCVLNAMTCHTVALHIDNEVTRFWLARFALTGVAQPKHFVHVTSLRGLKKSYLPFCLLSQEEAGKVQV